MKKMVEGRNFKITFEQYYFAVGPINYSEIIDPGVKVKGMIETFNQGVGEGVKRPSGGGSGRWVSPAHGVETFEK